VSNEKTDSRFLKVDAGQKMVRYEYDEDMRITESKGHEYITKHFQEWLEHSRRMCQCTIPKIHSQYKPTKKLKEEF
jgi:hypothetical protein